ncbi:MAG: trans-aconitate 2-methyltransferase [Paracoccaceae bacterium]
MISKFINYNRKASRYLTRVFPWLFQSKRQEGTEFTDMIAHSIADRAPKLILEAGGVDRPLLTKSPDYRYVGLDIDERLSCYEKYDEFLVQSIEEPIPLENVDLIVSITLLEHVPDNSRSFQSMYDALSDKGIMHHYIPSGYHPYSLALKLVGPKLQRMLIRKLRPEAEEITGYPTFFSHCSPGQIDRLLGQIGYQWVEIKPYYRATEYFSFFVPLYVLIAAFEKAAETFGWRMFCCGMLVTAQKTAGS